MDKGFYTFEDASRKDARLFKLATYEASGGMMMTLGDMEAMVEMQEKVSQQFNYFKKQIQNGETTMEHLTQQVIAKNGPYNQTTLTINEENIDQILSEADESYQMCKEIEDQAERDYHLQMASNFIMSLAMGGKKNKNTDDPFGTIGDLGHISNIIEIEMPPEDSPPEDLED